MKPFVPDPLPLDCLDVGRLIKRVGTANAAIARYDGLLQSVINPSVMLSPLTQREAVLSSRIEGTQATVDEVLEYEAGIEFDPEKTNDIKEVVNYRKTLTLASESLADRPITLSLIKQMHSIPDSQTDSGNSHQEVEGRRHSGHHPRTERESPRYFGIRRTGQSG